MSILNIIPVGTDVDRMLDVDTTATIARGDLLYLDPTSHTVKPVSGLALGSIEENRAFAVKNYIGVASGSRDASSSQLVMPVATDVIVQMTAISATFNIGDMVTFAGTGSTLYDQKLQKTTDSKEAIGYVTETDGTTTTPFVHLKAITGYEGKKSLAIPGLVNAKEAEADEGITDGMAIYALGTGHVKKAKADASTTALVVGFCLSTVTSGNTCSYQASGEISLDDWTAITGAADLTPGSTYYLSQGTAGQITASPPASGIVAVVGIAISARTLAIRIEPVIMIN